MKCKKVATVVFFLWITCRWWLKKYLWSYQKNQHNLARDANNRKEWLFHSLWFFCTPSGQWIMGQYVGCGCSSSTVSTSTHCCSCLHRGRMFHTWFLLLTWHGGQIVNRVSGKFYSLFERTKQSTVGCQLNVTKQNAQHVSFAQWV